VSVALLAILFSRLDMGALWSGAKQASAPWVIVALALYFVSVLASTWRWRLLLDAQDVHVAGTTLLSSYLVANFFNNFLPSNIGGDVIRISDTAGRARSKTLATMVVLVDRGLGLLGLVLIAALGATVVDRLQGHEPSPIWPSWLWAGFFVAAAAAAPAVIAPAGFGRVLRPLSVLHPTWVGERIEKLISALARFRERPGALAWCFVGAVLVQTILIAYHFAVVHALHVPVSVWDLAVIVPVSFVVQMVPVSLNGLGVREAAFSFYFTQLGLPIQSGVLVSLGATVLMMIFSLSGAAVYMSRGRRR
jgi:glycosyltransferase 2 family protein